MTAGPGVEAIREAVALACRAPSLHNSQPWRWVLQDATLHLLADPRRMMRATDHTGRELRLSCGAVLDHLRVAMAAAGWDSITDRFDDHAEPDYLAALRFRPAEPSAAAERRADAIGQRRTDRLPFGAPTGWAALQQELVRVASRYGVLLDVVADEQRPNLAVASKLTETLRSYDTSYVSELRWWTSPFRSDATHVPDSALPSSDEAARVDVARAFPPAGAGHRRAGIDHDRSKIVVLATRDGDDPLDVLQCGEALSAILLECTMAGMATCTLTHLTELAMSRNVITQITGSEGQPQLLIRVGRSPKEDRHGAPTPRRPVAEVLEFRG